MPNWKTYESSVRLLSAIVAAHPGLKLNYDEVGKHFGGGMKYKGVWDGMKHIKENAKLLQDAVKKGTDPIHVDLEGKTEKEVAKFYDVDVKYIGIWERMRKINRYAESLKEAVDKGVDPKTVPFDDSGRQDKKAKDIALRFGGGCTPSALENRFRRIKSDSKLINDAVKNGVDPITMNIGDTNGEVAVGKSPSHFGSDATRFAIKMQYLTTVMVNAKALRAAHQAGKDCKEILFEGGVSKRAQSSPEIAACFGSDTNGNALQVHFYRSIKPNVKRIRDMREAGGDCKELDLMPKAGKEMARIFGSDCTVYGLRFQVKERVRQLGERQLELLKAGKDPKDVDLHGLGLGSKAGKKEIARHFGSDTTPGGIGWQFRGYKIGAKLQQAAVAAGKDPKDINVDVNPKGEAKGKSAIALHMADGTTASALDHRFRPIKAEAKAMHAAVAEKYGEGVTETPKSTPRKRGPSKKSAAPTANGNGMQYTAGSDDEEEFGATPTPSKKKGGLNKVASGRVAKTKTSANGNGRARGAATTPSESFETEEASEMGGSVKMEMEHEEDTGYEGYDGFGQESFESNGYEGYGNGMAAESFYDTDDA